MLAGAFEGLLAAPLGDLAMVARQEDVGDLHIAKDLGAGVLGIFQQTVAKGVVLGRVFVTQGVGALLGRLGDDEGTQRLIRLEPRILSP